MTDSAAPDRRRFRRPSDDTRTATDPPLLARAIVDHLFYLRGRLPEQATRNDWYIALAYTVRDRLLDKWVQTARTLMQKDVRVVAYLSAEFLLGPQLGEQPRQPRHRRATQRGDRELLGLDFDDLLDAGGGARARQRRPRPARRLLPRFAGDARDPGDRLRHPLRVRHLRPGRSATAGRSRCTDKWLRLGNPWEIAQAASAPATVGFGGRTEPSTDEHGRHRVRWIPRRRRQRRRLRHARRSATASNTVNLLRLWKAEAAESFDFARLQRRRLLRRGRREGRVGEHHEGALPERRARCGASSSGWSSSTSSCPARCRT